MHAPRQQLPPAWMSQRQLEIDIDQRARRELTPKNVNCILKITFCHSVKFPDALTSISSRQNSRRILHAGELQPAWEWGQRENRGNYRSNGDNQYDNTAVISPPKTNYWRGELVPMQLYTTCSQVQFCTVHRLVGQRTRKRDHKRVISIVIPLACTILVQFYVWYTSKPGRNDFIPVYGVRLQAIFTGVRRNDAPESNITLNNCISNWIDIQRSSRIYHKTGLHRRSIIFLS